MFLWLTFLVAGCDNGLATLIFRPQKAPETFDIDIQSFTLENKIICSWKEDVLTDEYILLRSEDTVPLNFSQVFVGNSFFYEDSNLKDNTKYIYRLDKIRGKNRFTGKKHYLGVFGEKKRDAYEPNNSINKATYLEKPKQANLYYYVSLEGIQLFDVDWYIVRVKANRVINLSLTYDATRSLFKVILPPNGQEIRPANNQSFQIRNDTEKEKYFYFSVQLDKDQFAPTGVSAFYTYTIKLISETAIIP